MCVTEGSPARSTSWYRELLRPKVFQVPNKLQKFDFDYVQVVGHIGARNHWPHKTRGAHVRSLRMAEEEATADEDRGHGVACRPRAPAWSTSTPLIPLTRGDWTSEKAPANSTKREKASSGPKAPLVREIVSEQSDADDDADERVDENDG